MDKLADKFTGFVIRAGVVPESEYEIYQFGFQSGLEMISCFCTGLALAFFLHMLPEFLVFMVVFISLRTYAGGLHLEKFWTCFLCSVIVETVTLLVSKIILFSIMGALGITVICSVIIILFSPIDNEGHRLDKAEKKHCRMVVIKLLIVLCIVATAFAVFNVKRYLSLIALTMILVLGSQFIGLVKCKKNRMGS